MKQKTIRKTRRRHRGLTSPPTPLTVFTSEDYNSNDGMLTTVWGPGTWHFLHTMSFNYPTHPTEEQKDQYRHFILSLQHVLPCGKCRKNLVKNFRKLPLEWKHMESRETFSRYMYELHETVNKMLNKKNKLSYEQVRERYEHFRSRCAKSLKRWNKTRKQALAYNKKRGEKGCTEPLYGEKSKCILKIVPNDMKCETLEIDDKCIKRKLEFSSPDDHT
jgi:hypothetical protein